jgi:hypothetical protein
MLIYVAGPYMPHGLDPKSAEAQQIINNNIQRANEIAINIAKMGHTPFIPHTMMRGWEDGGVLSRDDIERLCHDWLKKCDGLYFIAPSPGAEKERKIAEDMGIPVIEDLKVLRNSPILVDSAIHQSQVFEGYLTEYKECTESYRHTYATIWQAGGLFTAISGGIIALWGTRSTSIPLITWVLGPLPILFWYQGIFRPMDRYGEARRKRLKQLEEKMALLVPGLNMKHFSTPDTGEGQGVFRKFLCTPRVKYTVHLLGIGLLAFETILILGYIAKLANTLNLFP